MHRRNLCYWAVIPLISLLAVSSPAIAQQDPAQGSLSDVPEGFVRFMRNGKPVLLQPDADPDNDGINTGLEVNGFTYTALEGLREWDGREDVVYYKTDPLQWSTDGDPYSDYEEATGSMTTTVDSPFNHPLVAALPVISLSVDGFDVIPIKEITLTNGEVISDGWTETTSNEDQVGSKVSVEFGSKDNWFIPKATVEASYSHTWVHTHSDTHEKSVQWSRAVSSKTDEAARLNLRVHLENIGSAPIRNLVPTLNLVLGGRSIRTFKKTNSVGFLGAGSRYPEGAPEVVSKDSDQWPGDLVLSLNDLKALQMGAPLQVEVTQVEGDVHNGASGSDPKKWAGFIGEIRSRCILVKTVVGDGTTYQSKEYYIAAGTGFPLKELLSLALSVDSDGAGNVTSINGRSYPEAWETGTSSEDLFNTWKEKDAQGRLNEKNLPAGSLILLSSPGENPKPDIRWAFFTPDRKNIQAMVLPYAVYAVDSVSANVTFADGTIGEAALRYDDSRHFYVSTSPLEKEARQGILIARDSRDDTSQVQIVQTSGPRAADPGWGFFPPFFVGDFNADGKTDIAKKEPGTISVHLSTGTGFRSEWWNISSPYYVWGGDNFTWVGDFNGDGRTDIASRVGTDKIYRHLSTGTGFESGVWSIDPPYDKWGADNFTWAKDFDGDGKTDFVTCGEQDCYVHLVREMTETGLQSAIWTTQQITWGPHGVWVGDFDGDGKTDFAAPQDEDIYVHRSTGEGFQSLTWPVIGRWGATNFTWAGDFDGNGKTDIASGAYDQIGMHLSTGTGFQSAWWSISIPTWGADNFVWTRDFDGDEKTDIASGSFNEIATHLSTGTGFNSHWWYVQTPKQWEGVWLLADFTGDKRADIAWVGGNEVRMNISTGGGFTWSVWKFWSGLYTAPPLDHPSAKDAIVVATVTRDGTPVEGVEVGFSRSISGRPADYKWNEITDAAGRAEIRITAEDPQFWRTGVAGYYVARAVSPASPEPIGKWGSIPINKGTMIELSLPIGGMAVIEHEYSLRKPASFELSGNYPNPFNPSTQIAYELPEAGEASLIIYNALGQEVRRLVQDHQAAGSYRVTWDGKDTLGRPASSGIYLYRLTCNGLAEIKRMLLLK